MSEHFVSTPHPYEKYADTPEWAVLDQAILELAKNRDLEETTAHPYIVGYLCEALAGRNAPRAEKPRRSKAEVRAIIEAAQAEFRAANPTGRDPLAELLAERREAAERGD